jgi:hypothetical protein
MRRTTPVLALAALLLLGTTACNKKDKAEASSATGPTPNSQDESTWRVYEQKKAGFAVALPPGWEAVPLDSKDLEQNLAEAFRRTPELKNAEAQLRAGAAGGGNFFAIDKFSIPTGYATNLLIARAPHEGPASLDQLVKELVQGYRKMAGASGPVTRRPIKLRSGQEAECISYLQTIKMVRGLPDRAAVNQYVVLRGKQIFFLNFATKAEQEAENKPYFDKIARSFRFLDK